MRQPQQASQIHGKKCAIFHLRLRCQSHCQMIKLYIMYNLDINKITQ